VELSPQSERFGLQVMTVPSPEESHSPSQADAEPELSPSDGEVDSRQGSPTIFGPVPSRASELRVRCFMDKYLYSQYCETIMKCCRISVFCTDLPFACTAVVIAKRRCNTTKSPHCKL
jgi:hypothetical protein